MKLDLEKYIIFDSVVSYLIKRGQNEDTVTVTLEKPNTTTLPSTKPEFAPGVLEGAQQGPARQQGVQKQPNIQQEFKVEQPDRTEYVRGQLDWILRPHGINPQTAGKFLGQVRRFVQDKNAAIITASYFGGVSNILGFVPREIKNRLNYPIPTREQVTNILRLRDLYASSLSLIGENRDAIISTLTQTDLSRLNDDDLRRAIVAAGIVKQLLPRNKTRVDTLIRDVLNNFVGDETRGTSEDLYHLTAELLKAMEASDARRESAQQPTSPSQQPSREGINVVATPAATQTVETPTETPTGTTTPGETIPAEGKPTTPEQVTPSPPTLATEEKAPTTPRSRVGLLLRQITAPIYRLDEEAAKAYLPRIRAAYGAKKRWGIFSSSDPEAERKADILAADIQRVERMIGGLPLQVTNALRNMSRDVRRQTQKLENLVDQYSRARATVYQNHDIIREVLSKYEGRVDLSDQDLNRIMLGAALTADMFGSDVESGKKANNQRQLLDTARTVLSEFVGNGFLDVGMVDAAVEIANKILERRGLIVGEEPAPTEEQPPEQPPAPEQPSEQLAPEQPVPEQGTATVEGLTSEQSAKLRDIAKFIGVPLLGLSALALALGDKGVLSLIGLTVGILGVMYGFGIFDKMGIDVDGLISQIFGNFGQKGGGGGGAPQLTEEQKKILSSQAGQEAKTEIKTRMDNYSKIAKQGAPLSPDLLRTPITQIDANRLDQSKEGAALKGIISSAAGLIYYYGDDNVRANIAKLYDQAIIQGDLRTLSALSNYLLNVLEYAYSNAEANSQHMARILAAKVQELSNLDSFMQSYGNKDITIQEIKTRLARITKNEDNKSSYQYVPIAILLGGLQNTLALTPETSEPARSFANSYITALLDPQERGLFDESSNWFFVKSNFTSHAEKVSAGLSLLQAAINQSR